MKSLKSLYALLPIFLMLTIFGCKKNNAGPENDNDNPGIDNPSENKGISMNELLDYYLVTERKTGNTKLAVMYFSQEGNVVKANLHGSGYLRSKEVVATNSSFSFNSDGFGTFNYSLEKDATGTIKLKSYDVNSGTDLAFALLVKKTNAPSFSGSSFKAGDLLFKFKDPTTLEWDFQNRVVGFTTGPPPLNLKSPIFEYKPEFSLPYYSLLDLGFKTNNDQFIGITVPSWKDSNTPVLLLEKNGAAILKAVKQP
jgi:hypothetical protein